MSKIEMSLTGGFGDAVLKCEAFRTVKIADSTIETVCHLITHNKFGEDYVALYPYIDKIIRHEFDVNKNKDLYMLLGQSPDYLGEAQPETPYPYIPFVNNIYHNKPKNPPRILIHEHGSVFSSNWISDIYKKRDKSYDFDKWVSLILSLNRLFNNPDFVIVGGKADLTKPRLSKDLRLCKVKIEDYIGSTDIEGFIDIVSSSDLVIAVDSAAKSLSLALQLPTIVLVRDYEDPLRDSIFLDPYSSDWNCRILKGDEEIFDKIPKLAEELWQEKNQRSTILR